MKKVIFTFIVFAALFLTANSVSAKGIIFYSTGEKIELLETLPPEATIDDVHINLGLMYDQFSIFWIPVWNYGETKYVLVNDEEDTYWDLDTETIELLKTDFKVEIPEEPVIGFWNKIGGKIIWGIVILVALAGWFFTRKDDKEAEQEA
jgi:hypothetical protein